MTDEAEFDEDLTIEQLARELDGDWSDSGLADRGGQLGEKVVVNWRTIEGEEREEASRALIDWVQNWLQPRYELQSRVLPDCWWQHGDMVEELSALFAAWTIAYDVSDGGYGPVGWHERFALALTRNAFRTKCTEGHRATPERTMPDVAAIL